MQRSRLLAAALAVLMALPMAACSPAVGSAKWCASMQEKPKGDWTANELADFAKHCVLP